MVVNDQSKHGTYVDYDRQGGLCHNDQCIIGLDRHTKGFDIISVSPHQKLCFQIKIPELKNSEIYF